MIYHGNKRVIPFAGNRCPLNIYKGEKMIAGCTEEKAEFVNGTGKNLLPRNFLPDTENAGFSVCNNADGSVTISQNGDAPTTETYIIPRFTLPFTLPAGDYTVSFGDDVTNMNPYIELRFVYADGSRVSAASNRVSRGITLTEDTASINATVYFTPSSDVVTDITIYPMIESGLSPTEYEPYRMSAASYESEYNGNIRNLTLVAENEAEVTVSTGAATVKVTLAEGDTVYADMATKTVTRNGTYATDELSVLLMLTADSGNVSVTSDKPLGAGSAVGYLKFEGD